MSVLYGIFNKNGKPVAKEELEHFNNSYNHIDADYTQTYFDNDFAVGFKGINILTEGYVEKQPIIGQNGRYIVAFRARIDNRSDIFNQLHLSNLDSKTISDSYLILLSYLKWGNECFDKFGGDFAGIIWDKYERVVIAARDIPGHFPLFYFDCRDSFYFASTLRGLLSIPGLNKEPDMIGLLSFALRISIEPNTTVYKYIKQFAKSHYYIIDKDKIQKYMYWEFEKIKEFRYNKNEDYYTHAYELFKEIVKNNLSTKGITGSYLSGGLDSSSVTVTASEILQERGKRIYSYSSVPIYHEVISIGEKSFADESPYIDEILKMHPNIIHQYVGSEDFGPIDAMLMDLNENKTFSSNAQNAYWIFKIIKLAEENKVNVLLNGQAGNAAFSLMGSGLTEELIRNLNFIELHKFIKNTSKSGIWNYSFTLANEVYTIAKSYLPGLKNKKSDPYLMILNSTALQKEIINKYNINERVNNTRRSLKSGNFLSSWEKKIFLNLTFGSKIYTQNADMLLSRKIEKRDPTADKRLIEFIYGLPSKLSNDGITNRKIARTIMNGHLPDFVRLNTKRGKQAKDLTQRVLNQKVQIYELLDRYRKSEFNNIFDIDIMNTYLDDLEKMKSTNDGFMKAVKTLLNGMYIAEVFLNRK